MNAQNIVDVDLQAIEGELLRAGEGAIPPDAESVNGPSAAEPQEGIAMDWRTPLAMLVGVFATHIAPNWAISEAEQGAMIDTGAATLSAFFPNVRVEGKWAALAVCGMTLGTVVMARYDRDAGAFRPLRIVPAAESPKDDGTHAPA